MDKYEALLEAQHHFCAMAVYEYERLGIDENRYIKEFDISQAVWCTDVAYELGKMLTSWGPRYEPG